MDLPPAVMEGCWGEAVPILGSKQHKVLNLGLAHLSVLGPSLPEGERPGALGQQCG